MPIEIAPPTIESATANMNMPVDCLPRKAQRIDALDFTKGALVLIMVLYHWINYFIDPQWRYLFYLRFLTPSFIFISGFMISHVYLAKYANADLQVSRRLITRGLKLLAIFLVLNVARYLVVPTVGSGIAVRDLISPQTFVAFFVFGNLPAAGPKLVSFSILVPISYLLIVSGALTPLYRRNKYSFHIACIALLLAGVILGYADTRNYNLEFVAIGMLGVVTGFAALGRIGTLGRHPYALTFAYFLYLVAITIWNVPFLLLIVAVLLNLCIIYLLAAKWNETSAVRNEVILLGKYSLFGYLSQVAILQFLSRAYQHLDLGVARLPTSFIAAAVLTILAVEFVDRARESSRVAANLYKAIFA